MKHVRVYIPPSHFSTSVVPLLIKHRLSSCLIQNLQIQNLKYIHPYELQSQIKRKSYQNSEHRIERYREVKVSEEESFQSWEPVELI